MEKVFKSILGVVLTVAAAGVFIAPAVILNEAWGVIPAVIYLIGASITAVLVNTPAVRGSDDDTPVIARVAITLLMGSGWVLLTLGSIWSWLFSPESDIKLGAEDEEEA